MIVPLGRSLTTIYYLLPLVILETVREDVGEGIYSVPTSEDVELTTYEITGMGCTITWVLA